MDDAAMKRWIAWAESKAIRHISTESPIEKAVRAVGIEVRPLLFWNPFAVAILFGSYFGLTYGIAMHLTIWSTVSISKQFAWSVVVGVGYGFFTALKLHRLRKIHGIPAWSEFSETKENEP